MLDQQTSVHKYIMSITNGQLKKQDNKAVLEKAARLWGDR